MSKSLYTFDLGAINITIIGMMIIIITSTTSTITIMPGAGQVVGGLRVAAVLLGRMKRRRRRHLRDHLPRRWPECLCLCLWHDLLLLKLLKLPM